MKVFELMAELSKHPAGAEVRFRTMKSPEEFFKSEKIDEFYHVDGKIEEVAVVNENLIELYE